MRIKSNAKIMKNFVFRIPPIFIIIIASLIISIIIAFMYIPKANVIWDEANYILLGYRFHEALIHRNLSEFWQITMEPTHYPPFQTWLIAVLLLPFKYSVFNARLTNLIWFNIVPIFLFILGKKTDSRNGNLIGLLAGVFFLMSPLVIFLASNIMLEMMGAALTIMIITIYLLARKNNNLLLYFISSLLISILTLTKYNYGTLLLVILSIEAFLHIISSRKRLSIITNYFFLFIPCIAILLLWLIKTNKITDFIASNTNLNPQITATNNLWYWLSFYPTAIYYFYSASPILGIIFLMSILLSIFYLKNIYIRLPWIAITASIYLATIFQKNNLQERFIFTIIPFVFLISAYISIIIYQKIILFIKYRILHLLYIFIIVIFGFKIFIDLCQINSNILAISSYTFKNAVFNQTDYIDKNQWYNYDPKSWARQLPQGQYEKPEDIYYFIANSVDLSKPYQVVGQSAELSLAYMTYMLSVAKNNNLYPKLPYSSFIITIEILPTSRLYTHDYLYTNIPYINYLGGTQWQKHDPYLKLINHKFFSNLGVDVSIYARN
jgi:hypothetical protein